MGFRGGDSLVARLDNYFPIVVHGPRSLIGRRARVLVEDYTFFDLRGRILGVGDGDAGGAYKR